MFASKEVLNYFTHFQIGVITLAAFLFISKQIVALRKHFYKLNAGHLSNTKREERDENEHEVVESDDDTPALPKNIEHIPYNPEKLTEEEMLKRSNEFYALMRSRRTVRYFSSKQVSEDIIRNIISSAGTSPSGAHTEPWTFVLVKDMGMKHRIRQIVEEEEYINYTRRMGKKWTTDLKPFKTNWNKPYLTGAPYLILLFKQLYSYTETGKKRNHYYNEISVAISSGILIAAIHHAGLATLTSTPLNCGARIRQILGRPPSEKLMLLFPVGYPAEDCVVPDITRKTFNEIAVEI